MSATPTYRVQRALTNAEIAEIHNRIETAPSGGGIVAGVIQATFSILLASVGESLEDYGPHRRLVPTDYAIPQTQWSAIVEAATSKADAFGAGVQVAIDLINTMPATYDDPTAAVPPTQPVDLRPAAHVLTVTREATDVVAAASTHCRRLAATFGPSSREYLDAIASWQQNLSQLFSMGFGAETHVSKDGKLSLRVRCGNGLVYAIIFRADQRRCTRPGCRVLINDDGRTWTYQPDDPRCADDQHEPNYPLDAPAPGTWSSHS